MFFYSCSSTTQVQRIIKQDFKDKSYEDAFYKLQSMLNGEKKLDFKHAVFLTENAFLSDSLNYQLYCSQIDTIVQKLKWFVKAKRLEKYKTSGLYAVYSYMCEPTIINDSLTYKYDFDDFMGYENWTSMFVTKLMRTNKGNCHSLPFFFKILSDEMGVESFLSVAPSHLYIKHKDEEGKWVNIELTNGGAFSSDAWIISSMGITAEAIKSGVYMSPLTQKESVAMCLYDLAMGYKQKYGYGDVVEMMCNKILEHYPNCIMALMLKSDCIINDRTNLLNNPYIVNSTLVKLETSYKEINKRITELGYTDMSPESYDKWARSVEEEMKKMKNNDKENSK